jgi:hypothetical protein
MTRAGIKEYAGAVRSRYYKASKKGKGEILDEFIKVTGCHRKAAIRLLRHGDESKGKKRPGRRRQYDREVTEALKVVWEVSDHLCSKRLHPFLREFIGVLKRHGEISISPEIESRLCQISPSTIDRLLAPYRTIEGHRPSTTTRSGKLLKSSIPIRTFSDWVEDKPGFLECDLVAHCGESTEGFYLNTLSAVDVATGWIECLGVWGKG